MNHCTAVLQDCLETPICLEETNLEKKKKIIALLLVVVRGMRSIIQWAESQVTLPSGPFAFCAVRASPRLALLGDQQDSY